MFYRKRGKKNNSEKSNRKSKDKRSRLSEKQMLAISNSIINKRRLFVCVE